MDFLWKSLTSESPDFESDLGSVQLIDADKLPALKRMSIKRVVLAPNSMREPQWNVNANQIAYVVTGQVLVTIFADGNEFDSFVVGEGQMYHVPSGAVYHIENITDTPAELIMALRTERPQHFSLRDSFSAMTNNVLGNAYDLPGSAFDAFKRPDSAQIIARRGSTTISPTQKRPNARMFDAGAQNAPVSFPYGSAQLARKQYWSALEDLSMYVLRIKEDGMRSPHWHPITAEMGYVAKGHARMRVLFPDLTMQEYILNPGDVYFVPRAYPHHIECLGEDEFQFLIFFDQPTPGDIGYRATASAFSTEVLSATFDIPERDLPTFPFTPADPLIVSRNNPVDPVTESAETEL